MSALALLTLALAAPPALEPGRVYDPVSTQDQEDLAARLRLHVPLVEAKLPDTPDTLTQENPRTGYAAVLSQARVVCLSFLVKDAEAVTLVGPKGKVPAEVLFVDHEARVAMLRPKAPLKSAGLYPVTGWVPPNEREVDMWLFALVSTLDLAGVTQGVLTHNAELREYGGFLRTDLKLERGMPVFDRRARLVGFSRVVAWDQDRFMIVPPEKVRSAKTSTAASARPLRPKKKPRPWWSK